jgi:hypothetical protein
MKMLSTYVDGGKYKCSCLGSAKFLCATKIMKLFTKFRKYKKTSLESTNDDEDKYKYLLFGSA